MKKQQQEQKDMLDDTRNSIASKSRKEFINGVAPSTKSSSKNHNYNYNLHSNQSFH